MLFDLIMKYDIHKVGTLWLFSAGARITVAVTVGDRQVSPTLTTALPSYITVGKLMTAAS